MIKENILKVLGTKFLPDVNLDYYLKDYKCDKVNFQEMSDINIFRNNKFELECTKGIVYLETTQSNQLIDKEWLEELQELTKIQFAIQVLIDLEKEVYKI